MKKVLLGKKWVGDGFPCFTVAEIGSLFTNFDEAKRLIDSAKEIGIDAVKFQTFTAKTITTKKNIFDLEVTGNISQYDHFKKFEISKELQTKIVNYATNCGITIFSAPSHIDDLDVMQDLDIPLYKIGSDLACHIPLLKKVAKLGKPIILSTGMCTMDEVRQSVDTIRSTGNDQLILLHCVSDYPAKPEESNLNAIMTMKKEFDLPVGFSDHTKGTLISLVAATIGSNLIEKHFRDTRNSWYPDDQHALVKEEFANLIRSIRIMESAKGTGQKIPSHSEEKNLLKNRVSVISVKDIAKGTIITEEMIDVRRPGTGISPLYFYDILGKKAKLDIPKEEPIRWNMVE